MYDARSLKHHIRVDEKLVECPVLGCAQTVARQRRVFQTAPQFRCLEHQIFISPTTFEYVDERDNLLWRDEQDISLLEMIKVSKRESRMARDNSEDALSWNVFRYLEKTGHLSDILSHTIGRDLGALQLAYWSYAAASQGVWPELAAARREFGELEQRSSEPDLIAFSDRALLFIEAKLTASNETTPRSPGNRKRYLTGGDGWYRQVFASEYDAVAVEARKYELLRFWLLGSWIASRREQAFYLVNVVRSEYEQKVEKLFGCHVRNEGDRFFKRVTWEEIYHSVAARLPSSPDKDVLLAYLQHKSVGYNAFGDLQRALLLQKPSVT